MKRWFAGPAAAAVAAAATVLVMGGAPAKAAADWLDVFVADLTVAAETAGKMATPVLFATTPTTVEDLRVTVDFGGLAGVGTITAYAPGDFACTAGETTLTCTAEQPVQLGPAGEFVLPLQIEPAEGAAPGATGTFTVTATARGADPASHRAKVTVGEGVDLHAGESIELSGSVGKGVQLPLTVTNVGARPANGAVLWLTQDYALRLGQRFSNCRYPAGWLLVACHFDTTLEPERSYTLAEPLPFTVGADTPAPGAASARGEWLTPAEWADFEGFLRDRGVPAGTAGTGGELELVPADAATLAGPPQADVEPANNGVFLTVNVGGTNTTDLAAVGANVRGDAGDRVVTHVGVKNAGPALAAATGESITPARITLPPDATAADVPDDCAPVAGGKPDFGRAGQAGAREYVCLTTAFLAVGDTFLLELTLRVDRVTTNATGRIEINNSAYGPTVETARNRANDTATIVLNASTGSGGGGGGGSGDDDETLPITGVDFHQILGWGYLLVTLGALIVLVSRRRS